MHIGFNIQVIDSNIPSVLIVKRYTIQNEKHLYVKNTGANTLQVTDSQNNLFLELQGGEEKTFYRFLDEIDTIVFKCVTGSLTGTSFNYKFFGLC